MVLACAGFTFHSTSIFLVPAVQGGEPSRHFAFLEGIGLPQHCDAPDEGEVKTARGPQKPAPFVHGKTPVPWDA